MPPFRASLLNLYSDGVAADMITVVVGDDGVGNIRKTSRVQGRGVVSPCWSQGR
jgi:hypothetical protein